MKTIYTFTFLAFAILLSACSSTPTKDIEVESNFDPKVNLSAYKTYAWLGSAAELNDPEGKWQPAKFDISSDIKFLIDRELRNKNMTEVQGQDAEVAISFFTGVDMQAKNLKVETEKNIKIPENVPKAALIVVALDAKKGTVIWIGVASGDINQAATVETSKARLNYAITKMFNPTFYDNWF